MNIAFCSHRLRNVTRRPTAAPDLRLVVCFAAVLATVDISLATEKKPALGAFNGNSPAAILQFERWVGRPVDHICSYGGRLNWSDWIGSIGWLAKLWAPLDKPLLWTIPLIPNSASLAEAATGAHNARYEQAARIILNARRNDPIIFVRTGEEFNGNWMPWAAKGKEQDFISAYRHFVTTFRSISDRFRFEWNVNIGDVGMDPTTAYPGDEYVDVIGMDFYYNIEWDPADPIAAWNHMLDRPFGLRWLEAFAASRSKPTAYSEWGVNSNTAGPYIKKVAEWFGMHNVLYQNYWNSNADFSGQLSNQQYPSAASAYLEAFGSMDKSDPNSLPSSPRAR